jgi:putative DNA primase/helicase
LTDDGLKAAVPAVKKVSGNLPAGSAVRLFPPCECIGIAEGIETALSAFLLFGVPTWAAVTACGLERWTPQEGTNRVIIFGDNDASCTGQASAWNLARRLRNTGIEAEVRIPSQPGDWNDLHASE